MEETDVKKLLEDHNSQMSNAFQKADTYSVSGTDSYCQVGEAQSKSLKVYSTLYCTICNLLIAYYF